MTTLNHDIANMHNRINRVISEVYKSVSSGVTATREADVNRWKKFLNDLDSYHNWILDNPQLDLPETHPKEQLLTENPLVALVENDSANAIIEILTLSREELINSQSSRLPSGFLPADSERQFSYVEKARKLIVDFIEPRQPIDFPESSPQKEQSGVGRKGI